MCVREDGKPCKTMFLRIAYDSASNTSLVKCRPFTGRSHQIRVHLQHLGYPIIGDPLYSSKGDTMAQHFEEVNQIRFADGNEDDGVYQRPNGTCSEDIAVSEVHR